MYIYGNINSFTANRSTVFDLQKHNISGLPDGMTIDTNGNLWIALYNGGGVSISIEALVLSK